MASFLEVRYDDKGKVDEIVGNGISVQLEHMGDKQWFLGITSEDFEGVALWFEMKRQPNMEWRSPPAGHRKRADEVADLRRQLVQCSEALNRAINRRVKVENKLIEAKNGLTREELVSLALELGTPEEVRS
jgi:hypothetical protein